MSSRSTRESDPNHKVPTQMRGLLLEEFNKPYVYHNDLPVPKLQPGMLLIRVKVAGFCHTDLLAMSGGYKSLLPMIPGHESVGIVVAVGEGTTGFTVGDRVGTLLFRGKCSKCRECLRGTPNYCVEVELAGLDSHGGMAQYLLAYPAWIIHIPKDMKFAMAAPLMCAGATVYHSLLRCGVQRVTAEGKKGGGLVGIMGVGGLGHLGVQFAKAMGYSVVALDKRPSPLEFCRALPQHLRPDLVLNSGEMSVPSMLKEIGNKFHDALVPVPSPPPGEEITHLPATGLDTVLVCTDAVPAFVTAINLLAKHGTLVYIGQPEEPVPMHWSAFVAKDITVVAGCLPCGRWGGPALAGEPGIVDRTAAVAAHDTKWMTARNVTLDMMELVQKVGVRVEVSEYKFEEVGELMGDFRGDKTTGKVVLRIEDD